MSDANMTGEPAPTNWLDALSDLGRQVLAMHGGDAYHQLVVTANTTGPADVAAALRRVRPAALFAAPPNDADEASATLAGLWLWHDGLGPAHDLAQKINNPTGSYWHAILHRREGDFSNSQYWYDRAAGHPVLAAMASRAATLLGGEPGPFAAVLKNGWHPHAFVDLVEQAHRNPAALPITTLARLQMLEWETLFDHTVWAAMR